MEPKVSVKIAKDKKSATASGNFQGLYARIAYTYTLNGSTGLFVTQGVLNPNGVILMPRFGLGGLKLEKLNVALVKSLEDINSPSPKVVASDFTTL